MGAERGDEKYLKVDDEGYLIKIGLDRKEEASSFYISDLSGGFVIAYKKHPDDSSKFVNYEGSKLLVNTDEAKIYVLKNINPSTRQNYSDDVWRKSFFCIKIAGTLMRRATYFGWESHDEFVSLQRKRNRAEFKLCAS